jgi:hypothetical protein
MTYRVRWSEGATEAVQRLYDVSLDQEAVLNTVTRIGLELSAQPEQAGESREAGTRILFKYPLVVWFRIHERMKEVVVFEARSLRT